MSHPIVSRQRHALLLQVVWVLMGGLLALTAAFAGWARASEPAAPFTDGSASFGESGRTLVLPLRTIGVGETTAAVARDLLAGELESRGMPSIRLGPSPSAPTSGPEACDDLSCAARLMQEHQARRVVYGSLAQLGGKIIVRVRMLRSGETSPYFDEQLNSIGEEDLDVVMRRLAEGIAAGRPNSNQATVQSITRAEVPAPRRRMIRSGLGVRTGFLYPMGNSYLGSGRLTNFRLLYKLEAPAFLVEASGLVSMNTGEGVLDYALLDLFVARIYGIGDVAPYAGGGLGIHRVSLERDYLTYDSSTYMEDYQNQDVTALSLEVGGGLLLLRTYNWHLVADIRYHVILDDFTTMGGKGAHGLILSFGINH